MNTIKVFPRKTNQSPDDENVRFGCPGLFDNADKIMVSVAFTWDKPLAEQLAKAWEGIAPVEIGGPAYNAPGGEFEPGLFLKRGVTITSRGCPNRCWFCSVPKREGYKVRELEIKEGWIIQDDNLLACSDEHIKAVFAMLKKQNKPIQFQGGLEAKILKDWHIDLLADLKPYQMFFAYDTPDDLEPLIVAGKKLLNAGLRWSMRCFVLLGYPGDTFEKAKKRLRDTMRAGFMPMAMLYRNEHGDCDKNWRRLSRLYARPALMRREYNQLTQGGETNNNPK